MCNKGGSISIPDTSQWNKTLISLQPKTYEIKAKVTNFLIGSEGGHKSYSQQSTNEHVHIIRVRRDRKQHKIPTLNLREISHLEGHWNRRYPHSLLLGYINTFVWDLNIKSDLIQTRLSIRGNRLSALCIHFSWLNNTHV